MPKFCLPNTGKAMNTFCLPNTDNAMPTFCFPNTGKAMPMFYLPNTGKAMNTFCLPNTDKVMPKFFIYPIVVRLRLCFFSFCIHICVDISQVSKTANFALAPYYVVSDSFTVQAKEKCWFLCHFSRDIVNIKRTLACLTNFLKSDNYGAKNGIYIQIIF